MLALSATPIPRTLQMSLAGLRDISVIETPPEGRRPVRTYVGPYDEDLVRKAIERELERGGQAFFLHNRIRLAARGRRAAARPGAEGAASPKPTGRWTSTQLEETMLSFLRGEADCLVTTTIIESGLDIPTANTLIVERADQLGLSQAYQIRGRVGRSRERAFAYLLYPSPEALTEEAAARLSTLADHTELGSGFRIAMRDLDIRGAGNLLGDEQSGHVAAVGFELYCQMIDEAVAEARAADGDGRGGAGAGPPRRPGRRLPAGLLRPLRGGEDRRPPPHRRGARAGRAAGDPRRARATASGRCRPRPRTCWSCSGRGSSCGLAGARSVEFRGGGSASPGSSSTPRRPACCASRSRGRSTSGGSRPRGAGPRRARGAPGGGAGDGARACARRGALSQMAETDLLPAS